MSGRITKESRSTIVSRAVAFMFTAREKALEASREQLADELYRTKFGMIEAAALALPPGWVEFGDTLVITVSGWTSRTRRFRHQEERWEEVYEPHHQLKLSKPRVMPAVDALREVKIEKGDTLFPHTQRIAKEHRAILEEKDALREKLNALLNSVTTYKKLREAWPEGEQFFPDDSKPIYAVVPATLTHDINRMLGLEPKGTARKAVKKAMSKETS